MKQNLRAEINATMKRLIQLLSSFDQEQINIIPFEGSWTAGQLAEHMVKSNGGFLQLLSGPVTDTKRNPDDLEESIKSVFLNFSTKMKSPDFVVPETKHYEKEDLLLHLEKIRTGLDHAITTLDLTKTCTGFELPVYKFLTRYEALCFVLYHTQRHIHQLENILKQRAVVENE